MSERRVLVIHPGALGDVIQAVPALRALGEGGRVAFCGQPRLGALLAGAGVVAEALSFDGFGLEALFTREAAPRALVERLRGFDRVVSWFGSRDDVYAERLRTFVPGSVVAPPVPAEPILVWRHLLATLAPVGDAAPAPCASLALRSLEVPDDWRVDAGHALARVGVSRGRPLVVVHPGAGGRAKLVPPEVLAGAIARVVADSPQVDVLVHEGPADRDAVARFAALAGPATARLTDPPLPCLAGILSLASAYLGGDSGVSHLAAAVGVPAVILFSAASLERWSPWSPGARSLLLEEPCEIGAEAAARALSDAMPGAGPATMRRR